MQTSIYAHLCACIYLIRLFSELVKPVVQCLWVILENSKPLFSVLISPSHSAIAIVHLFDTGFESKCRKFRQRKERTHPPVKSRKGLLSLHHSVLFLSSTRVLETLPKQWAKPHQGIRQERGDILLIWADSWDYLQIILTRRSKSPYTPSTVRSISRELDTNTTNRWQGGKCVLKYNLPHWRQKWL